MAHIAAQFAYQRLTERLNLFPQGAHPSALLTKILMILFEKTEAELVSLLPIKPLRQSVPLASGEFPNAERTRSCIGWRTRHCWRTTTCPKKHVKCCRSPRPGLSNLLRYVTPKT